jgi:hypothetical protein
VICKDLWHFGPTYASQALWHIMELHNFGQASITESDGVPHYPSQTDFSRDCCSAQQETGLKVRQRKTPSKQRMCTFDVSVVFGSCQHMLQNWLRVAIVKHFPFLPQAS